MHGGGHHGEETPLELLPWSPRWVGTKARSVRYPVQFSIGDQIMCYPPGVPPHIVTFAEPMEFDTEEELRIYICDCVAEGQGG